MFYFKNMHVFKSNYYYQFFADKKIIINYYVIRL